MDTVKKITFRVLLLSAIILASSLIYNRFFYLDFIKKYAVILYQLDRSMNADYIYFGASSDYTFDKKNDIDSSRISIMAMRHCDKSIKSISEAAHHAGLYKELIKHIPKNKIKGIIVSLNLRSFSPLRVIDPNQNALNQYEAIYTPNYPIISRFKVAFKDYPICSENKKNALRKKYFKKWQLPYPYPRNNIKNWCSIRKNENQSDAQKKLTADYIKSFGVMINDTHIRTKDFDKIVELAHQKGLKLIFHILPENIDKATEIAGSDLGEILKNNSDFIINRYHNPDKNVWVIDNLEKVRDKDFLDQEFPTEHYNEKGRKVIAKSIGELLNKIE